MTYIEHGEGTRVIGSQIAEFKAGDLVLIGSNLPHWYYNPVKEQRNSGWARSIVIQFLPNFLGDSFLQAEEMKEIRECFSLANRGIEIVGETNNEVVKRMKRLTQERGYGRLLLFLEILHCLLTGRKDLNILKQEYGSFEFDHYDAKRFDKVFRFLNEYMSEDIRLEDVAKIAGMVPVSFSRFYKQKTGKTYQQTLIEIRLLKASQLLLGSSSSIAEICFSCGFNNLSNFNRQFKRMKNMTPKQFRNKWG